MSNDGLTLNIETCVARLFIDGETSCEDTSETIHTDSMKMIKKRFTPMISYRR